MKFNRDQGSSLGFFLRWIELQTQLIWAFLQTMEKVTQELDWSCMTIEIDFRVKVMSISALIILPITTQQLF